MSESLEKIMMLRQMNGQSSPFVMDEQQRRNAQGDAMIRMAAEMGNPKHRGQGLDRMLTVLNASINPALDAYNNAEQIAVAQNLEKYKLAKEEEREMKREAERERKVKADEEYNRKYLEMMEGRGKSKEEKASGRQNPYYGMPQLGKLILQGEEIKEGFVPGTNKTKQFSSEEEQKYFSDQNELAIMKLGSDTQTRQRSLFAKNLVKSIDNTNLDDLVQYSGPQGRAKLAKDMALDAAGMAPPEYIKYQEASTAAKLEAKELRQFLGESITPSVAEAIETLVNPTSAYASSKAAKAKIQKSRDIIKKQLDTYQKALLGPSAYRKEESEEHEEPEENAFPSVSSVKKVQGEKDGKRYEIPIEHAKQFEEDGGLIIGY